MQDPGEWVRRLQAGEDEAWREFVKSFARFVPIVSNRLGLPEADRQEVLQDMTITAFRSIRNLRDPSRLASWTYTIAHRAAINVWKARGGKWTELRVDGTILDLVPSDLAGADEMRIRMEEANRVRLAVAGLGDPCRRILEALYLETPRLTYRELSERHGIPIGSIGPNLARCLRRLARALKSVSDEGERLPAGVETQRNGRTGSTGE